MYRVTRSIIASYPALRVAFGKRGIVDYAMAVWEPAAPGHKPEPVQVFVYDDGRIELAASGIVAEVAAELQEQPL